MTAKPAKRKRRTNQAGPQNVATIEFIDIVGSSTISNVLGIYEYAQFLADFRKIAVECIEDLLQDNYGYKDKSEPPPFLTSCIRGDEACIILFSDYGAKAAEVKAEARRADANAAIEIALRIKQEWLGCKHNRILLNEGKLPCDLGIGIYSGPVHVTTDGNDLVPEGYAINLAKRIEGESRRGAYSHIFVGQFAKSLYDSSVGESTAFFDEVRMTDLKGILQAVPVYEIKYFTLPTAWREFYSSRDTFLSGRTKAEAKKARQLHEWACKARDVDRSNPWLATVCGNLCLADERYDDAEEAFLELRNAHPRDPEPHTLLGNVYGEQEEYAYEQECYKRAIELNPYVEEWWYYLGLSLSYSLEREEPKLGPDELQRKVRKIISCFDEAIYLNSRFSWAYYDRACIRNQYAEKEKAQEDLDRAVQMDEECEKAAAEEKYLRGLRGGPKAKKRASRGRRSKRATGDVRT